MTLEQIEQQMWDNYDEGYKAGRSETINKACEWLKDYVADYLDRDKQYQLPIIDVVELITDFRKEMEEQQ